MNTVNLDLIRSIQSNVDRLSFFDCNFAKRQISLVEKIWRKVLSTFFHCIDSPRTACLRRSLSILQEQIQAGKFKVLERIKILFPPAPIYTLPAPRLEQLLDQIEEKSEFKNVPGNCGFLMSVAQLYTSLVELFKDSRYPLREVPIYKGPIDERVKVENMTAPIMMGFGNKIKDLRPFLAIKVRSVSSEGDSSAQQIIQLGQRYPSGPYFWEGNGKKGWYELSGQVEGEPRFFHSGNITCLETGGLVESQKNNCLAFQKFLETGEGTDQNGVKWKIVEEPGS